MPIISGCFLNNASIFDTSFKSITSKVGKTPVIDLIASITFESERERLSTITTSKPFF